MMTMTSDAQFEFDLNTTELLKDITNEIVTLREEIRKLKRRVAQLERDHVWDHV